MLNTSVTAYSKYYSDDYNHMYIDICNIFFINIFYDTKSLYNDFNRENNIIHNKYSNITNIYK